MIQPSNKPFGAVFYAKMSAMDATQFRTRGFWTKIGLTAIILALAGALTWGTFKHKDLQAEHTRVLAELQEQVEVNAGLEQSLRDEVYAREKFEEEIEEFADSLGILEKLAQTDEELLKKYSKIYFLNENYVPAKLSDIPAEFSFPEDRKFLIHADVEPYLTDLLEEAGEDGVELRVASAFRSFDTQAALKGAYTVQYGSGANQFSADQGYSEHQLGTTVDFTTPTVGGVFNSFESDPAYKWLEDNAHKYGFVLSYPKNNAYYKFEPWHWRYVGRDLARDLHRDGKSFYDLDQREIDEYLVKLFD